MKNKDHIEFLAKVSTDILAIKNEKDETLAGMYKKFYAVMRKYGIKRGKKTESGVSLSNPEWIICERLFQERLKMEFTWTLLKCNFSTPKDLEHY